MLHGDSMFPIYFGLILVSFTLYLRFFLHEADSFGVMTSYLGSLCFNPDIIQAILRTPSSRSRLMWCDDDILLILLVC